MTDADLSRHLTSVRAAGLSLALAFLVLHLPFLPASLEDLDSVNFALGMRQFDVAKHQPHPPGYPVFVLASRMAHIFAPSEPRALGLLSLLAGTLGVLAITQLFKRFAALVNEDGALWTEVGAAIAVASPLYWFTAVRPLSDSAGLAVAIAVQALTLGGRSSRAIYLAGFCAGVAAGIRSQVIWLTAPLLFFCTPGPTARRGSQLEKAAAFAAGCLVWLIPLIALAGGPAAYWRVLFTQGAEDLSGVRMLWTTPTPRVFLEALYYAFVAPWAVWPVAVAVLALAGIGVAGLQRRRRRTLLTVATAFGPYFCFDILFQETVTGRYALPLVVPVAYLATEGLRLLPRNAAVAVAAGVVTVGAYIGETSIAAYSRQSAPAFRLLTDMRDADTSQATAPVAAMDRRVDLDLRRPLVWLGEAAPRFGRRLPAPPQHEWLEPVKFWNSGGRAPVWFVVDPLRTAIHLVQHGEPVEYRWAVPYHVLLSGVRPNEMDWYRVVRPEWYVGEGWALTPEAAGVAEVDHRGLSFGEIEGWVRSDIVAGSGLIVIGGRNFEPTIRPRLTITAASGGLRAMTLKEMTVPSGSFVDVISVPVDNSQPQVPDGYLRVVISAAPPARMAIEQFDASLTRPVLGFGDGWHEQEYNPTTGKRWRWLSERGELRVGAHGPFMLRLEGESPLKYFSRASRLVVRTHDRVVFEAVLSSDFSLNIPFAAPTDVISLETDQTYVPANHGWRRTQDRRHLGLRIFRCELRLAAPQGS